MYSSELTVIIPVYNGAKFLREAIESIWNQTEPADEIIIIDDCSKDNSMDVIEALILKSPVPMRLMKSAENSGGPARPINIGIHTSRTEYLTVLDQDDLFRPERLATHKLALDKHPDATAVFGYCADLHNPDEITQSLQLQAELATVAGNVGVIPGNELLKLLMRHGNFIWGFPGFTFRREAVGKGVDESYRIAGDMDLICRLAEVGSFVLVPDKAYYRRRHDGNMTRRALDSHLEDARVREAVLLRSGIGSDSAVITDAGEWFRMLAYWVREAGHPIAALRLYRAIGRIWGWDYETCLAYAKVLPLWLTRAITFRQPRKVTITTNN